MLVLPSVALRFEPVDRTVVVRLSLEPFVIDLVYAAALPVDGADRSHVVPVRADELRVRALAAEAADGFEVEDGSHGQRPNRMRSARLAHFLWTMTALWPT